MQGTVFSKFWAELGMKSMYGKLSFSCIRKKNKPTKLRVVVIYKSGTKIDSECFLGELNYYFM
ncbi:MAG: hypothetical protein UZ08_BCD001002140 [Candidatus Parvibacillus calidus]|nr:MAG: hypothetical protein UZ08_BCD001002140 [Candidatus Parvibacillus calidus]WKZ62812.1 MAG: hypothetical protein QY315_13685 [Saprospiraceae bacterium]